MKLARLFAIGLIAFAPWAAYAQSGLVPPNTVVAGPASGSAKGFPAARPLVAADVSALLPTLPVSVVNGGTGATTAAGARTNLGLAIGTNVQAWDADLDCLAALASTGVLKRTGAGTCAAGLVDLTTDVTNALPVVNGGTGGNTAALARTNLGLAIGSAVQAWDADLDCLAALATTGIVRRTGAGTCTAGTVVTYAEGGFGAAITGSAGGIFYSGATNAALLNGTATARLPLLSGASALPAWGAYTLPASVTSGGVACFTSSTVEASSVAMTANAIMLGGGAGACPTPMGSLGTATQVLHGNAAGAPTWGAVSLATDVTGNIQIANIASGTGASSTTFLRGDNTWATPTGGGTVTTSGSPTTGQIAQFSGASVITGVTAVPVANGGTGDTGTAWTSYTPTLTCTGGTLTTASATGRYKVIGKTTFVTINSTITTLGSCSTALLATLPNTANSGAVLAGREFALTGKVVAGFITGSGTTVSMTFYDNTLPAANGYVVNVSGVYENQ